jgi:hypothetical protein
MRGILCYVNLVNVLNLKTKKRKGLITYYKTCGITTLKKHVGAYHSMITKKIEEKVTNLITKMLKDNL